MSFKKGLIHIGLIVLALLLVSAAGVSFAGSRARGRLLEHLNRTRKPVQNNPTPIGSVQANPRILYGYGTGAGARIVFTAKDVRGANGARIDNVRYFLLKPYLPLGHNWGPA